MTDKYSNTEFIPEPVHTDVGIQASSVSFGTLQLSTYIQQDGLHNTSQKYLFFCTSLPPALAKKYLLQDLFQNWILRLQLSFSLSHSSCHPIINFIFL